MIFQADLVNLSGKAVDELAFGKVKTRLETLHDIHTDVMASVEEGFHKFAESRNSRLRRPLAGELGIFGSAEVEVLLMEASMLVCERR